MCLFYVSQLILEEWLRRTTEKEMIKCHSDVLPEAQQQMEVVLAPVQGETN